MNVSEGLSVSFRKISWQQCGELQAGREKDPDKENYQEVVAVIQVRSNKMEVKVWQFKWGKKQTDLFC